MKLKTLLIITGLCSLVSGLSYLVGLYGPTEAEVKNWAMLAILAGAVSLWASRLDFKKTWMIACGAVGYLILALAQILPIYMWFTAPILSDKQSTFVVSAWYSVRHFTVAILAVICLTKILDRLKIK
jgi:hypothetical protein